MPYFGAHLSQEGGAGHPLALEDASQGWDEAPDDGGEPGPAELSHGPVWDTALGIPGIPEILGILDIPEIPAILGILEIPGIDPHGRNETHPGFLWDESLWTYWNVP